MAEDTYLYEQIADELGKSIQRGVYAVAQRLPSLRYISEQYEVSMATAIQAYQSLERAGLIESRPKSGYFVRDWGRTQAEAPSISQPSLSPTKVNVGHLAMSLINEARQPGLVKLGAAVPQPELLPIANLARTLAGVARRRHREAASYEQSQGNLELRKQIVRLMQESGVRCSADDIIITNGCLEALGLALRAVAKGGDTIAIESPTYFGVMQVIESLGMKVLEIATHPSDGIDLAALEKALRTRKVAACVLIPTFSNPLGSCMPDDNKQQALALLDRHQVPLIEDDIYGALSYEAKRPRAIKSYDRDGSVLYCSSFSKTLSPGMRVGWIMAGRYHEQVKYQKFLDNISTAIHPQLALAEFLAKGGYRRSVRHAARIYRQRMEQLRRWVTEYFPPGTRITQPRGGFVFWVELPERYDAMALYQRAIEKKIAITPGILFSAQGQYRHHIRLSCGSVEGEQARKVIRALAGLLI